MPEPADVAVPVAQAQERHNVFLVPDSACDVSKCRDSGRDVEVIWPPTGRAGAPLDARARGPSRRRNRLARRYCRGHPSTRVRRLVAALAVAAITATLLGFALAQPNHGPPRDAVRPAAPTAIEPVDVLRRRGVADAAKRRRTPTPRAPSRLKPPARAEARPTSPPRAQTPARPESASSPPRSAPSSAPAPSPTPAPASAARRTPTLPVPVPSDAPPEFM